MNKYEKKFLTKLSQLPSTQLGSGSVEHSKLSWQDATPSMQIQAYEGGKKKLDLSFGKDYRYYDLASLTKVLFTGRALMTLVADKKLKKTSRVESLLSWWPYPKTNLQELLSHNSGLVWWSPYYKELIKLSEDSKLRFKKLGQIIQATDIIKSEHCVYSDAGFLILGFLLEAIEEQSLAEVWSQNQDRWGSKNQLHFRPLFLGKLKNKEQYAPTEKCPWTGKLLQGLVHDENARALGGVAPHAGLFGGAEDVSQYLLMLRRIIRDEIKKPVISALVLKQFIKRAVPRARGDWAMGWMLPTKGASSSGKYFSASAVGHTGFTGTSMWWDPVKDRIIVILSNRVSMGRENKSFAQLRPLLHDFIIESLEG